MLEYVYVLSAGLAGPQLLSERGARAPRRQLALDRHTRAALERYTEALDEEACVLEHLGPLARSGGRFHCGLVLEVQLSHPVEGREGVACPGGPEQLKLQQTRHPRGHRRVRSTPRKLPRPAWGPSRTTLSCTCCPFVSHWWAPDGFVSGRRCLASGPGAA